MIFIERDDAGEWLNVNSYVAAHGFAERGVQVVPFTWGELKAGRVALRRDAPVHGTVRSVLEALRQLAVPQPSPLDYPMPLEPWLGRRVWSTTLADAVAQRPVFAKPHQHKAFPGTLIAGDAQGLSRIAGIDPSTRVYASEIVEFGSEWRVFVLRGEIIDARRYRGDPFWAPDRAVVKAMVAAYGDSAPVAYALDVGRSTGGADGVARTLLVEVNDALSLGTYGLPEHLYVQMIEARWAELTA